MDQLTFHLTPESERDRNEQHSAVGAVGLANLPGRLLPSHLAQRGRRARDWKEEETGVRGFHWFAKVLICRVCPSFSGGRRPPGCLVQ